jgi:hypothetical protein
MSTSKFTGIGITDTIFEEISPQLSSRIWLEIDAVPMVFPSKDANPGGNRGSHGPQSVDEVADMMARECIK